MAKRFITDAEKRRYLNQQKKNAPTWVKQMVKALDLKWDGLSINIETHIGDVLNLDFDSPRKLELTIRGFKKE